MSSYSGVIRWRRIQLVVRPWVRSVEYKAPRGRDEHNTARRSGTVGVALNSTTWSCVHFPAISSSEMSPQAFRRLPACLYANCSCSDVLVLLTSSFIYCFFNHHSCLIDHAAVFSERELVRYMSASVCLSSVTFVQANEIFGNVSTPFNTLVIWRHPGKILRRSSQGNPSVGRVKHKRGGQYSDFGPFRGYISETVQDRR